MIHEKFDEYFTACAAVEAEGARIGITTCLRCGAAVVLDPRDSQNFARFHHEWHEELDAKLAAKQEAE